MSRHLLTLALLLLAASAQGVTPARSDANGAGGTCPEAQATAASTAQEGEAAPLAADSARSSATPAPSAPVPSKASAGSRAAKAGDRWHSFLPGMFK